MYYTANLIHAQAFDHIYLSPHLDDGVLSCGGRIWQHRQAGQTALVVTVFAGAPAADQPLSPFAQSLHDRWGHHDDAPSQRRQEDLAALQTLGADGCHWPCLDCIYRRSAAGRYLYADDSALWGDIAPEEEALIEELTGRIAALPLARGGRVYAPLAVGHHVDHQIVRRAAEAAGGNLYWYEDYPYAENFQAVQYALHNRQWQTILTPLSEAALIAKIAAIACYRSQISSFWADPEAMDRAVRGCAARTGDGLSAERGWRLRDD
jgi:LmbE family N-acetylglucosaminyl deacetylase